MNCAIESKANCAITISEALKIQEKHIRAYSRIFSFTADQEKVFRKRVKFLTHVDGLDLNSLLKRRFSIPRGKVLESLANDVNNFS